jgi:hypothetical protein
MPVVTEPVAESEEQEQYENTNKRDANSKLIAEIQVPSKEHTPQDDQAEGQYDHVEQPEDRQDVHLESYLVELTVVVV